MTTALDIITEALEEIGVKESGQSIPAEEAARARRMLNRILGSMSHGPLALPVMVSAEIALTGASSYTIGPSGCDLTAPRPLKLISALQDGRRLRTLSKWEWDGLADRFAGDQVLSVYLQASSPVRLFVSPVASHGSIQIEYQSVLDRFDSLSEEFDLPGGYDDILSMRLAEALCPTYGLEPPASLLRRLSAASRAIRRTNAQPIYVQAIEPMQPAPSILFASSGGGGGGGGGATVFGPVWLDAALWDDSLTWSE